MRNITLNDWTTKLSGWPQQITNRAIRFFIFMAQSWCVTLCPWELSSEATFLNTSTFVTAEWSNSCLFALYASIRSRVVLYVQTNPSTTMNELLVITFEIVWLIIYNVREMKNETKSLTRLKVQHNANMAFQLISTVNYPHGIQYIL